MPQADSKSSSGQEQRQIDQTAPYPSFYPQQFEDDAIDLYELWISLWNRKWLVIAVTVVAALGAVVYALQLKPVYKAQNLLLPPSAKDLLSINLFGLQDSVTSQTKDKTGFGITSQAVFNKFKQNLYSRTLHKKFIQEYGLMDLLAPFRTPETRDQDIITGFAELIKLGDVNGITSLSIELHDAKIAAQWVNDFTKYIDKVTVTMVVDDIQNSIANQIRDIEYTIESKRQMAKQRRGDQISRLFEAVNIANKLGIKRRVDATNIIQNTQMNVDIATATTPLYYLGSEALLTEISILQNRNSDDPFIGGLRDLQEKLALLRSVKVGEKNMRAVQIDQSAYPPKNPIKPNRRLIVSLATVVGLFSGIFLAFFIDFVQKQRKKHSE